MKRPYGFIPPSDSAVRSYRLLLRLYPPQFRNEFGGQMTQLFRDCLRDARNKGEQMVLQLWLSTLFDTCVSAPRAHLEEWTAMQTSYTRSSQIGAICAVATAILWSLIFGIGDLFDTIGTTLATIVLLAGMLTTFGVLAGLYNRLNVTQRSPFTLAGGISGIVGLASMLAGIVIWLTGNDDAGWGWYALMASLGLLTLAFGLMGVSSSRQPALGPLRFAPLLPFGVPIMVILILFFYSATNQEMGEAFTILVLALALLGILGTGALLWTKSK